MAEITGPPFKQILNFIGGGATYVCYVNGSQVSFTTAIKYPVIAGGVAARQETTGSIKTMVQLMPLKIDRVGAASVLSGGTRYEMADDAQVYLWYKGQYYPTKLSYVNTSSPAGTTTSAARQAKRCGSSSRSRTIEPKIEQRRLPHTAAAALGALPAPLPFL